MILPSLLLLFCCTAECSRSLVLQVPSRRKEATEPPFTIQRITISKNRNASGVSSTRQRRDAGAAYDSARNVTDHLNRILENYDKALRPNFNHDSPTEVFIDLLVRTMGPISEKTDTYSFDCYFRQTWTDDRLRFEGGGKLKILSLSMAMLDRIWKPDVFFLNGAGSYVHTLTVPNRLVRLSEDGTVLFSMRLTVKAKCRMDLHRYPLDRQACRLVIGSFAYPIDEMTLQWKVSTNDKGVQMEDALRTELPQFTMSDIVIMNQSIVQRERNYSSLEVRFFLDRHFGYFLMNFYVPCTLIVLICWVAFWINREATQERIGLVITNVLTIMFISLDSKADSPKTDFPTALDVYIWICVSFLFLCMVEFTIVHYFTKFNTGDPELVEIERQKIRQIIRSIPRSAVLSNRNYNRPGASDHWKKVRGSSNGQSTRRRDGGRYSMYNRRGRRAVNNNVLSMANPTATASLGASAEESLHNFHRDAVGWRLYHFMLDQKSAYDPFYLEGNSISAIDRVCRVALPLVFGGVVVVYYHVYVKTPFEFSFGSVDGTLPPSYPFILSY